MSNPGYEIYRFGRFWLSPSRHALYRDEAEVPLWPKSFEVLLYLATHPGRLVTKEELIRAVWPDAFIEEGNLAQHISRLRKAFESEPGAGQVILTIPGRGYQFTAEVSQELLPLSAPTGPGAATSGESPGNSLRIERWRERTHLVVEELSASGRAVPERRKPWIRGRAMILAACSLAIAVVAGWGVWRWRARAAPSEICHVVLADFVNTTGDATFDRTLRRALEVDLEQSPSLDIMSERTGVATLQMMGRSGDVPLIGDLAREICERTNRRALIEGTLSRVGTGYLVILQATDCATGTSLTSAKAEANDRGQVLATVDKAAEQMRSGLGESASSLANYQVPLREATTPSLEALKALSMGVYLMAQGRSDMEAKPFFERAIELDPHFAMAYGELSAIYYNNNDRETSRKYMAMAFQERFHVSAKERLKIEAHYYDQGLGDLLRANEAYRVWGETYPDDWVPWVNIANNDNELGMYRQAILAGERALQLGPERAINYSVLMRAYTSAGRFSDTHRIYELAMQRKKDSSGINAFMFNVAYVEDDEKTIAETDAWSQANPDDWYYIDRKAEAAATSGRYKDSVALFQQAYDIAKREKLDVSADDIVIDQAQIEAWFGMIAAARRTLVRLSTESNDGRDLVLLRIQLGNQMAVQRFLDVHKDDPGTLMKYVSLPQARAAMASQRDKPLEAISYLDPARPYELESSSIPTQLGEIYLQAHEPELALAEYQKVVSNAGIDPICPQLPLAHLGLARIYALQHNVAASRREYETLFSQWKNADQDLPVLQQARLEFKHLRAD
jgi:DNA-binding winged helix-turn-helix (wHTH) protein/Tfp pilus assembly protein PilF